MLTAAEKYDHNFMVMSKRSETWIGSADFKARCLEIVEHVREARAEYVVTRHGRPVARLVPASSAARTRVFGSMASSVLAYEDPFGPIPGRWDVSEPPASDAP